MEIKLADNQKDFFALIQLRRDVFVNEQKVDINIEMDDYDLTALHFVVWENRQVVATCRLVVNEFQAKLGRMAIALPFRHRKIGSLLLAYVENYARENAIKKIIVAAQIQALDFYLYNHYLETSEIFYEANIAHKMVEKIL